MTLHFVTPLVKHYSLSSKYNKNIYLKMDCYQPVMSFKIRGIGYLCEYAKNQGYTQVASASGGNAGYATAYAALKLGMKSSVFLPKSADITTQNKLKELGANVIIYGDDIEEASIKAMEFCEKNNVFFIHPFNHPLIWQGHSSIVDELYTQIQKPDAIILSVGGGGLLCGIMQGLIKYNWQDIKVIGSETIGTSSLHQSIKAKKHLTLDKVSGIATSLGAKKIGDKAFEYVNTYDIQSVVVSDEDSLKACVEFAYDKKVIVEPACGASLAVIYNNLDVLKDLTNIVVIVCGGINTHLVELKAKQL